MFVAVEDFVKRLLSAYGFNRILEDFNLTKAEVLQILNDHGYIDLDQYEGEN